MQGLGLPHTRVHHPPLLVAPPPPTHSQAHPHIECVLVPPATAPPPSRCVAQYSRGTIMDDDIIGVSPQDSGVGGGRAAGGGGDNNRYILSLWEEAVHVR
jgi:hypothetical protein